VQNAYRVLDEQLRRGEEAARSYRTLYERGELSAEDLPGLPRSAIRLWSEVLGLWLDVLGPLAPAGLRSALRSYGRESPWPEAEYTGQAGQAAPGFEPMRAQPLPQPTWTRVTLDISTTRPVEVNIDLSPDAEFSELIVQDLVAFEGGAGKPPITAVKLEPGRDGRLVLRLFVPPEQPPGTYLGMILDRAHAEQRGTLRLLIRT